MSLKISKIDSRDFSKAEYNANKDLVVGPKSSYLKIKLSGTDVTYEFLNCIRRIILNFIPTYAFAKETINIKTNTTNINNDMIKLRISQLPLFDIPLDINILEDKYWKDVNYTDKNREKHENDNKIIDMYIKSTNTSNNIINVTTNDIEFYINEKQKKKYDKTDPILVIQISPKSEFICHAQAVIGIGYKNDIWSAGTCHYYDESDYYVMIIKSSGQFTEKEILIKACKFTQQKLQEINIKIEKLNLPTDVNKFIVVIEDEDFTCCSIINYYIQNHESVLYSGLTKENHNIDTITFKIELKKNDIHTVFTQAIKEVSKLFEKFEDIIVKI